MIGLPTETDEDLVAIRDLTLQMRDVMMKHARAARPHRPHRRQREPADSEAGHRLPVAADGRSGGHRPQDQAAARADRRTSTTSTSTSSRSGIPTTRRCCRSAIAASRRRSRRPSATAATGAPPSPKPASTPTSTSSATASHDAVLPWDIIDGGMKASFFQAEFDKGLREEWTLPPKRQQENAQLPAGAAVAVRVARRAAGRTGAQRRDGRSRLVLLDTPRRIRSRILSCAVRVDDRPQQREAAPLAVDGVLPRRERDVAAVAGLAAPRSRSQSASALRAAVAEMQLGVGEFSRRVPLVVRHDLDRHRGCSSSGR